MWFYLLVNGHAGNGNGSKVATMVTQYLQQQHISYERMDTSYPFHERILVHQLVKQGKLYTWDQHQENKPFPLLIVISGDGTLHEVVNTLQDTHIPLAYIPVTKSDFAKGMNYPNQVEKILQQILACTEPLAINTIYYKEFVSGAAGLCLASLGIGLDADVDAAIQEHKQKAGFRLYQASPAPKISTTFKDIAFHDGFPINVLYQGKTYNFPNTFFCSVANMPYLNQAVTLVPKADVFREDFDLVLIEKQPWLRLLYISFLMWRRKHFQCPHVFHCSAKQLRLISPVPQRLQLDGQVWEPQPLDLQLTTKTQYIWYQPYKK